ncbi:MAG TPA: hypothetical protein VMC04_04545 [Verrucomicrobiae bacterium]|jgi:hypothetical protein|nr:hypothetical protein [Verrucomicrobiae bacterium]
MTKTLGGSPARIVGRCSVGSISAFGITIDEAARPAGRALTLPGRLHPVAGGR